MSILDEEGQQRQVQPRFLDLSAVHVSTKEELQNIMFKMLEVRLRPDKLSEDEINRIVYCESSSPSAEYPFLDPVPASMREVNLSELSQVDIDWKMLTLARPNTKQEMEIFTRFVELEKLKLKSLCEEDAKAETRVTAIKIKVQADGFEQETNSDEFTYEYFSRRHAAEEIVPSEDSTKKQADTEKKKLSEKLDSVTRQETLPDPRETPSPVPDIELETKRKLSVRRKSKKLLKKKSKRRKRRIKRLKNGRVVFITVKRRKKWYSVRKKKRKGDKIKKTSLSMEQTKNVIKPFQSENATAEDAGTNEEVPSEIKDSKDVTSTKSLNAEARKTSAKLRGAAKKNKKSMRVSKLKNASDMVEVGAKTRKNALNKTGEGIQKLGSVGRHINITRSMKGVSSRTLVKRSKFVRSSSIRSTRTLKPARTKITQTPRVVKESTNAKLDADGKEIEPDEIGEEGRATEENVSSAKLSSASGQQKMKVKNRSSRKTLIRSNADSKRTHKSSSEKTGENNQKESQNDNNDNGPLT